MTIEITSGALDGTRAPRVTKAPARFQAAQGPGEAPPKLLDRIGFLRGEAFDLVRELRERDEQSGGEYEQASERMQGVANQLASVQALLARDRA